MNPEGGMGIEGHCRGFSDIDNNPGRVRKGEDRKP